MRSLIFITVTLASIVLALDVKEKSKIITASTIYHDKLTIEKGVYLGLVGGNFHNFHSDVKVRGGLYVRTDDSSVRKNNRLVGNFENDFNTVIDLEKDTVPNSFVWQGNWFQNMGNMSIRGTPYASSKSQSLTFSSFSNAGFLQFVDTGYLQFGKEGGTITNTGTIAAQSDQFNPVYLIPQSTMKGNGCLWLGSYCIFYIENLDNIKVKDQTIVLSSEPNAIVLGGSTDPQSRKPSITSLKIRNFNSETSIWFHDNKPKIKSFVDGILTVKTIGRTYMLDFGPGYTSDQFAITYTPVSTQLWQNGTPLDAGVLRTKKVKTTLPGYRGCIAPQAFPNFDSFKERVVGNLKNRPCTRSSTVHPTPPSGHTVTSSLESTWGQSTRIFSSTDSQYKVTSSLSSSNKASRTATDFFSFASSDASTQSSGYIPSLSSFTAAQSGAKSASYTSDDLSSQSAGHITSGLDTTGRQSLIGRSQSATSSSNFATPPYSYSIPIPSNPISILRTSDELSMSSSQLPNDITSEFTDTTSQSTGSSGQYFSSFIYRISSQITLPSLGTTTIQSVRDIITPSSRYILSDRAENNTKFTSNQPSNIVFHSSVSILLTSSIANSPSSDYFNDETTVTTRFSTCSTSFSTTSDSKFNSLNQIPSPTNFFSDLPIESGSSFSQQSSRSPSDYSSTAALSSSNPTSTPSSTSPQAENSTSQGALVTILSSGLYSRLTSNPSITDLLSSGSTDNQYIASATRVASTNDKSEASVVILTSRPSADQSPDYASSTLMDGITQWESSPAGQYSTAFTLSRSCTDTTAYYSNNTQHISSNLDAKYFTQTLPNFLEGTNSISSVQSFDMTSTSVFGKYSGDFPTSLSIKFPTGMATLTSLTGQSSSSVLSETSIIHSSSFVATEALTTKTSSDIATNTLESSSRQSSSTATIETSTSSVASSPSMGTVEASSSQSSIFIANSSLISSSRQSLRTITIEPATSQSSTLIITETSTSFFNPSSKVSATEPSTISASQSSTPTITHHVSSTVDAKYFTQTSSSFLENDETVSLIQSSDTDSSSTSDQSSSISSINRTSGTSIDVVTLTSYADQFSSSPVVEPSISSTAQHSTTITIESLIGQSSTLIITETPTTSLYPSSKASTTETLASSASPSSTPTITHHVSSTVDAKYFTQTSSSFLESDDTVSSIQSSDTNSISTSGQSSSDFLSIPSSWLSTDITTSSSSDKRSLSTISTETSGIASSPFSSIYHISSSDNTSHTSTTMATIASSKSSKKITNRSSTRSTSLVSSGSVGQSSTQPEIPINISSTVTTNSVSHSDSYFLVQSTVNELNNDSTTTPTHSKAQKSASLIASLSTRTTTSAPQISDSQHLNNEASRLSTVSTSEPQVLPSSLPSFKSGDTNAELSTFASFTTVYKEWSGTFTHSYFTQVSRMYDNSAEMVKGEIKGPDGGIVVESIYYVETPTTYKAPTAVTMGSSAIFSARIDSDATEKKEETTMATITTCGSYLCTGTVSSAIISTVTTKIGDAVTKYTTWCPLSAAVSVEENTEIFLTSSALDNLSEPPSAVIKPTFTSTNDIARRPELTVDSYSRTDGSGTVVASKSIKTATSSGGIGGTSGHTTFSAKTHESAASSSSRVTSVISHESSASIPGLVISIGNVPSFESPLTNVQSLITTSFTSGSHFQIYSSSSVPHSDRASLPLSTYAGTANNLLSNSAWSFLIALMWLVIS
ncbi:hypothetical protein SKDZ_06G1230 [Saccharomyces kudriavzevii ZP591]|nr:hypothetical protein SKDZ_06G1230 [Saccharomyces kudriavzevii ZP591]